MIREADEFVSATKELESDFDKIKKLIKNSSITAFEVWLELGVKAGAIKEKDAEKLMKEIGEARQTNESSESEKEEIQKMVDKLWGLREKYADEAATNEVGWVDDSIDLVEIGYLGKSPESTYQNELAEEGTKLSYEEAKSELETRIKNFLDSMGIEAEATNEAEGDGGELSPEAAAAFEKELEAAMKIVLKDLPADLKDAAGSDKEIELAPGIDAVADKELKEAIAECLNAAMQDEQQVDEAIGSILVGGALALPAITKIVGKAASWAGTKIGSGDLAEWGKAAQEFGDNLHHKYEGMLDKLLSPFTKNMPEQKRAVLNKVIFYAIIAAVGGAGIAGAAKAAGAGQATIAAIEGGLSGIKAQEIASAASQVIPRVLSGVLAQ